MNPRAIINLNNLIDNLNYLSSKMSSGTLSKKTLISGTHFFNLFSISDPLGDQLFILNERPSSAKNILGPKFKQKRAPGPPTTPFLSFFY